MVRSEVVEMAQKVALELIKIPGVRGVRLYGSQVKDTARVDSDIDVAVTVGPPWDSGWAWGMVEREEMIRRGRQLRGAVEAVGQVKGNGPGQIHIAVVHEKAMGPDGLLRKTISGEKFCEDILAGIDLLEK